MVRGVFLVGLVAALSASAGVSPIGISLVGSAKGSDDAQMPSSSNTIVGFRLGLLTAGHKHMYGIAVSTLVNEDDDYGSSIMALQLAGMINSARSSEYGVWQLAGLSNILMGDGCGMQLAAIHNETGEMFNGFMLTGIFGHAKSDFIGGQLAGICNVCSKDLAGVQLGGVNYAASLSGVQLGVINIAGSSTGSNTMYGLQLGVFNIFKGGSDQFHGIQLGLMNFVTRSDMNALPLLRIEF